MKRPSFSFIWYLSLAAACASAPAPVSPPTPSVTPSVPLATAPAIDTAPALPLDPRVTRGTLANGLTYYVLPHRKPEKRAYLWLAVNAGSVLEDDDQQGLAHFVEHMGFNGTKRFPKQAMIDLLEKMGVKFGPHLNAYTSFDETVYMLQVPTDDDALVDKGLAVLRDWAGDLSFDPAEVEKERGVVLEEWRLGRGAGMRIFEKQGPVFFHGSTYARRLPIGKPEIIKGAPRNNLLRFYKDWYRPDLMALIAVGDFKKDEMEKKITAAFADLPRPASPRPRVQPPMPAHGETLVTIETDAEMPGTSVAIFRKMARRPERTLADYRRGVAEGLYHAMINARFDEIRRRPDSPFSMAGSGAQTWVRSADVSSLQAMAKQGQAEKTLVLLVEEVARVDRHGFRPTELERAKKQLLRQARQGAAERDNQDGSGLAGEIVRNFLEGESMPGADGERDLIEKIVPTLTTEELTGLARAIAADSSRVVSLVGPASMVKPKPAELLQVIAAAEKREIAPYEDKVATGPLLAQKPTPGKIVSRKSIESVGVTEWRLSNGVRVVIKPTTFKNDELRFSAFSPGGHSLVKDADFDDARFAGVVAQLGGLGQLDQVAIRKALAGRIVNVTSGVGELEEYVSGSASPEDLESLFELTHLTFTAPRRDESAFQSWKAREIERVRNRRLSPEGSFNEDLQVFLSSNHRRRQPITPELLQKVDLDRALLIYKDRFSEAGDFTFVFVGNIDLGKLEPLVTTYLGSLPSRKRKEAWKDVGVKWPVGMHSKIVERGREPKSQVMLAFHGKERWSRDAENDLRMLGEVLRIRLREALREDMGGVYGVGAGGGLSRRPRQEYTFTVNFGCAPDNVEALKQRVLAEIANLQKGGIGPDYLEKIKQARRRARELDLKENGWWEDQLEDAWRYGEDPKQILDEEPYIEKISKDRVKAAARKYLHADAYVLGLLKPDAKAPTP